VAKSCEKKRRHWSQIAQDWVVELGAKEALGTLAAYVEEMLDPSNDTNMIAKDIRFKAFKTALKVSRDVYRLKEYKEACSATSMKVMEDTGNANFVEMGIWPPRRSQVDSCQVPARHACTQRCIGAAR
jgi:hypothetical protein